MTEAPAAPTVNPNILPLLDVVGNKGYFAINELGEYEAHRLTCESYGLAPMTVRTQTEVDKFLSLPG